MTSKMSVRAGNWIICIAGMMLAVLEVALLFNVSFIEWAVGPIVSLLSTLYWMIFLFVGWRSYLKRRALPIMLVLVMTMGGCISIGAVLTQIPEFLIGAHIVNALLWITLVQVAYEDLSPPKQPIVAS